MIAYLAVTNNHVSLNTFNCDCIVYIYDAMLLYTYTFLDEWTHFCWVLMLVKSGICQQENQHLLFKTTDVHFVDPIVLWKVQINSHFKFYIFELERFLTERISFST